MVRIVPLREILRSGIKKVNPILTHAIKSLKSQNQSSSFTHGIEVDEDMTLDDDFKKVAKFSYLGNLLSSEGVERSEWKKPKDIASVLRKSRVTGAERKHA